MHYLEHFATPLAFAQSQYNLTAELVPEPLGTGALTQRLKAEPTDEKAIDVAIGRLKPFECLAHLLTLPKQV
jgi:hypothetical protein